MASDRPARYDRSWDDPAIRGVDLALRQLDGLVDLDGIRQDIRECTEDARRDAIARWNATASMSSRNTARRPTTRTQRYREAIQRIFFDDGLTGSVYVRGPIPDARWSAGRPVNLPLWLEYGTSMMAARPHLIPAFEMAKRKLNRLIEQRLSAAAR